MLPNVVSGSMPARELSSTSQSPSNSRSSAGLRGSAISVMPRPAPVHSTSRTQDSLRYSNSIRSTDGIKSQLGSMALFPSGKAWGSAQADHRHTMTRCRLEFRTRTREKEGASLPPSRSTVLELPPALQQLGPHLRDTPLRLLNELGNFLSSVSESQKFRDGLFEVRQCDPPRCHIHTDLNDDCRIVTRSREVFDRKIDSLDRLAVPGSLVFDRSLGTPKGSGLGSPEGVPSDRTGRRIRPGRLSELPCDRNRIGDSLIAVRIMLEGMPGDSAGRFNGPLHQLSVHRVSLSDRNQPGRLFKVASTLRHRRFSGIWRLPGCQRTHAIARVSWDYCTGYLSGCNKVSGRFRADSGNQFVASEKQRATGFTGRD